MSSSQIEALLTSEIVGRIGCSDHTKTYIIPITYVFKGNCIYAQSQPGHKIDTMRKNPNVCFQVDAIENQENWRSVIVWGTYEEINDTSTYEKAHRILYDRLLPMHTNAVSRGRTGSFTRAAGSRQTIKANSFPHPNQRAVRPL
ncbi:MAG: pyridoxamine 5'-phosphate oxidase family protein [Bacteroidota bacterium]